MSGQCEVKAPTAPHTHTVILLHGRGSNGEEFNDEFLSSTCSNGKSLPEQLPSIRWVLPTSASRLSTVFKEQMTEWFDICSLSDPEARQNLQAAGLAESVRQVCAVIDAEVHLVPPSRIFLGGISMGCATAIHALLAQPRTLAGFVGVAGWLPFAARLERVAVAQRDGSGDDGGDERLADLYLKDLPVCDDGCAPQLRPEQGAAATPVFLCHGTDDGTVDVSLGRRLRDACSALRVNVTWREDDNCGHWIKEPEAVDALVQFLRQRMGQDGGTASPNAI